MPKPILFRFNIRDRWPRGLSVAEGRRLMGMPRSSHQDKPELAVDD
jgi:hypothetical protein